MFIIFISILTTLGFIGIFVTSVLYIINEHYKQNNWTPLTKDWVVYLSLILSSILIFLPFLIIK